MRKTRQPARGLDFSGTASSTFLVWVEDVVLRLHRRMTRVAAIREAFGIGRELIRCGFVVEHRVSPAATFRKSLAVLFHDESLAEDVWHLDDERGFSALFVLPLELHDHGAIGKRLAVARNAGLECLDHRGIGHDYLEYVVGPGGRDVGPVLVSLEVGERDSTWRSQRVLVVALGVGILALREKGDGEGERCDGYDYDGKTDDTFHGSECCCLAFLLGSLLWRRRFRHRLTHGPFSFAKQFYTPMNIHLDDCH